MFKKIKKFFFGSKKDLSHKASLLLVLALVVGGFLFGFGAVSANDSDSSLSVLTVSSGTLVPGFDSTVFNYNVELPFGVSLVPTVTATATDASSTPVVTDATSIPGTTSIEVTAWDSSTSTYLVNFTNAPDTENPTFLINGTTSISSYNSSNIPLNITFADNDSATGTINGMPITSPYATSSDGSYVLIISDPSGNEASTTFSIHLSSIVVSGVSEGSLYGTSSVPVTITFSDNSGTSTLTALLDGTPFSYGDSTSADGHHTLIVSDPWGNSTTTNFTIDTTPPVFDPIVDQSFEAVASTSSYSLTLATALDALSALNPISYLPNIFPLGTTTVTWTASDVLGNTSTATSSVGIVDTTAPVITSHSDVIAEATSASGATVTYTPPSATDLVSGTVSVGCASSSGSLFPIGTTTVNCLAIDDYANSATSSFDVIVQDTIAPTTTATAITSGAYTFDTWTSSDVTVTLNATDTASGVDKIYYSTSTPESFVEYSTPFTITTEGTTTVKFYGIDVAGNLEATSTVLVKIDKTAPSKPSTMSINGGVSPYASSSTVTLDINLPTDATSGLLWMQIANHNSYHATETPAMSRTSWVLSAGDGSKDVKVRFYDLANNVSSTSDFSYITLDTHAPTVATTTITPSYVGTSTYITNTSNIAAAVNDNNGSITPVSGIDSATCEYTLDNGSNWVLADYDGTRCYKDGVSTSGATHIGFRVKDNAGNQWVGVVTPVFVDSTSPSVANITITPSYSTSTETYIKDLSDLSASTTDAGSGIDTCEYTINNGSNWVLADYNPANSTCYKNGVATIGATFVNFRATDHIGNLPAIGTPVSVTLDVTSPTLGSLDVANTHHTTGGVTYITVLSDLISSVIDGGSDVKNCRFGTEVGGIPTWTMATSTLSGNCIWTGLDTSNSAISKIWVEASDNLDNVSSTSTMVFLDTSAPTTTASAGTYTFGNWTNQDVSVTLIADDGAGSGVANINYVEDGAATTSYTGVPVIFNTEGVHTLDFYSVDNLGNLESVGTVTVKINKTKPVITLSGDSEVTLEYGATYVDSGASSTDDIAGDISANIVTDNPVNTNTAGVYYVKYNVTDSAGNMADEVSRKVTVNSAPHHGGSGYAIPLIGKVLGENTDKAKELALKRMQARRMALLRRQLALLRQQLRDLQNPPAPEVNTVPLQEEITVPTTTDEVVPTTTVDVTAPPVVEPEKKPFWKFW